MTSQSTVFVLTRSTGLSLARCKFGLRVCSAAVGSTISPSVYMHVSVHLIHFTGIRKICGRRLQNCRVLGFGFSKFSSSLTSCEGNVDGG